MSTNHAAWILGVLFCPIFAGECAAGTSSEKDVWKVLIGALPAEVSVKNESETSTFYVLRQTHEPVFRQDDGQNYASRILKRWGRNNLSTEYLFCPDTTLRFDAKNGFSFQYFLSYISEVTKKYEPGATINKNEGCVSIRFQKPKHGYLDFLSKFDNAPSIKVETGYESGLGPFFVKSVKSKQITLERKKPVRNGYNKVIFHEYSGPGDVRLNDRSICDFNKLSTFQQPEWIQKEFAGFFNIELRVVGLAINNPDSRFRDAVYNCVDAGEFREAFLPERKGLLDVKWLLPLGIPGGEAGRSSTACTNEKKHYLKNKQIVLANLYQNNAVQLREFSKRLFDRTGLKLIIKNYVPKDLVSELHNRSKLKSYGLIVIVSDTVRPEYAPFFEYYLGEAAVIDSVPADLRKMYKELLSLDGRADKVKAAMALASGVQREAVVLPLYQSSTKLYYPQNIKNLDVGRGFSEYPEVADFRW